MFDYKYNNPILVLVSKGKYIDKATLAERPSRGQYCIGFICIRHYFFSILVSDLAINRGEKNIKPEPTGFSGMSVRLNLVHFYNFSRRTVQLHENTYV